MVAAALVETLNVDATYPGSVRSTLVSLDMYGSTWLLDQKDPRGNALRAFVRDLVGMVEWADGELARGTQHG